MNNFFGLNSGSSEYYSRRHVNLIYYTYFQYRVLAGGDDFLRSFAPIFQSQDERRIVDHTVNNILGNYEYSFLVYLKNRYNLSNIEFDKILSGITHYDEMVKSPAGYSVKENWILVIHLLYAQLAVKPELHKFDIQIQLNFIVKLAQGMRGCRPNGLQPFFCDTVSHFVSHFVILL